MLSSVLTLRRGDAVGGSRVITEIYSVVDCTAKSQPINFDNGTCLSAHWFTEPGNPRCPFAQDCGAFARHATAEQLREVFGETG